MLVSFHAFIAKQEYFLPTVKTLSCVTLGIPVTEPVHSHENKWTFLGVGLAMFLVLVALLLVYVIKRRRRDRMMSLYSDKQRFS